MTKTPRTITAEHAAALVTSGMLLDYGGALSQPDAFDAALASRVPGLSGLVIRSCFTLKRRAVLEADPGADRVGWISLHFSGYDRRQHDEGRGSYMPVNLGEIPDYYRRFARPVDIVVIKTRPMDEGGWFNFSLTNIYLRTVVERARIVIVETSRALPHVHGHMNGLHASEVDYVIEGSDDALPELPPIPVTDVDRAVGRRIAGEIEDGSCLQIGIGAMPNAVCSELRGSGLRDLGIHTEMMTDGLADLYLSGQANGVRKTLHPGKCVFTFAAGSARLYGMTDNNPDMHCMPTDSTNLPHIAMQNDNLVSINNTTSIDLTGQAASESDGHRHISGTGGQAQFVRAAYRRRGGSPSSAWPLLMKGRASARAASCWSTGPVPS